MASTEVLWVGRLSGPKGESAYRLMSEVAPRLPQCRFTFIGGPLTPRYEQAAGDNVVLKGWVRDVMPDIQRAHVVIGAGRVALEAMSVRTPVLAFGEQVYLGPVTAATIERAKATNFGDCAKDRDWDLERLYQDLRRFSAGELTIATDRYGDWLQYYAGEQVYRQVMAVYDEARVAAYLRRFREIPVLMYHRVVDQPPPRSKFNVYVTRETMDWQLVALKRRGYTSVTFRDLLAGARPAKPIMLTFDDGYQDNHDHLLPLLQKHGMSAVIFALGDRSLRNNAWDVAEGEVEAPLMDDPALRACADSGHVEIGSHGLSHAHLPQVDDATLARELESSKQRLEAVTGEAVTAFAYPYGDYGEREAAAVRRAGYRFGIGTVNGPLHLADDFFRIRRIQIFPHSRPLDFWKKTSGYYLRYCRWRGKDF